MLHPATPHALRTLWPAALLRRVTLVAAGDPFRLTEVELYDHRPDHPDPYPHRHPLQAGDGRWYFHRVGSGFRGGSYQGLDLSLGNIERGHFASFLIRGLQPPGGGAVSGPSKCVDALLRQTGCAGPSELHALTASHGIFDPDSPLHLRPEATPRACDIAETARVGLSLRDPAWFPYWGLPLRWVILPQRSGKGRVATVVALHRQGMSAAQIATQSGASAHSVPRWLAAYEQGKQSRCRPHPGERSPKSERLAELLGGWAAQHGG